MIDTLETAIDATLDAAREAGRKEADRNLIAALEAIVNVTHDTTAITDFDARYEAFDIAAQALKDATGVTYTLTPARLKEEYLEAA